MIMFFLCLLSALAANCDFHNAPEKVTDITGTFRPGIFTYLFNVTRPDGTPDSVEICWNCYGNRVLLTTLVRSMTANRMNQLAKLNAAPAHSYLYGPGHSMGFRVGTQQYLLLLKDGKIYGQPLEPGANGNLVAETLDIKEFKKDIVFNTIQSPGAYVPIPYSSV